MRTERKVFLGKYIFILGTSCTWETEEGCHVKGGVQTWGQTGKRLAFNLSVWESHRRECHVSQEGEIDSRVPCGDASPCFLFEIK